MRCAFGAAIEATEFALPVRAHHNGGSMTINFIVNDPRASSFNVAASITQRANRPATKARFKLTAGGPTASNYAVGSPAFVTWQAREAALLAVEVFESIYGSPIKQWARAPQPKELLLEPDAGQDLNAYYNGRSVSFFHEQIGSASVYSGASTDVVAHEVGHALLDVLRSDLWDVPYLEVGSFHEAFGDLVAIFTSLNDAGIRRALTGSPGTLKRANFLETTAEELSWAIGQRYPRHNASVPRKARNTYQWVLPSTLPANGSGGVLINEVHSFAQIFTGCIYDSLVLIYTHEMSAGAAGLWSATKVIGQLLCAGTAAAPARQRFFRTVGQAMLQADNDLFSGRYSPHITTAFKNHAIDLAAGVAFSARSSLSGRVRSGRSGRLTATRELMRDVRSRLRPEPGSRLDTRAILVGGQSMLEVRNHRAVDLSGIAEYLDGVQCFVTEPVVVGRAGGSAAVMSSLPDANAAQTEARVFVEGLARHGQIEPPGRKAQSRRRPGSLLHAPTHRVVVRRGQKVLERVRFACGLHSPGCSDSQSVGPPVAAVKEKRSAFSR
jgi:hypothetical protein